MFRDLSRASSLKPNRPLDYRQLQAIQAGMNRIDQYRPLRNRQPGADHFS